MSDMIPIIRQMHDADGARARADILLRCPDAILLKHAQVFRDACQRSGFEAGSLFVDSRVALMCATRNAAGGLPGGLAMEAEAMRAEFAAFAAGAPTSLAEGGTWPLDAPVVRQAHHEGELRPAPLDI